DTPRTSGGSPSRTWAREARRTARPPARAGISRGSLSPARSRGSRAPASGAPRGACYRSRTRAPDSNGVVPNRLAGLRERGHDARRRDVVTDLDDDVDGVREAAHPLPERAHAPAAAAHRLQPHVEGDAADRPGVRVRAVLLEREGMG